MEELWQYIPHIKHGITHVCHNHILQEELAHLFGVHAIIRPVFWNDITKYPESYEYSDKPEVYITSHPGRDVEYGEGYMSALSQVFPDLKFHIYGNDGESTENLIYHGAISEAQMDLEIKDMQICLRMNNPDGFSQTSMKAILMGQYLITCIEYKHIDHATDMQDIIHHIDRYLLLKGKFPCTGDWREQLNNFNFLK